MSLVKINNMRDEKSRDYISSGTTVLKVAVGALTVLLSVWSGDAQAAQNGARIATYSATQSGVNPRATRATRAGAIRQTQALTPASQQDDLGELLAEPQLDSLPLEDPANYQGFDETLTPEPLQDYNADNVASPLDTTVQDVAPAVEQAPARLQATEAPQTEYYPQSSALQQGANTAQRQARPGVFSNAVSNNPYSRIGLAEYHPSQFYGAGGNYSVNGYRNTPPAFAYGQSMCGTGSCYGGNCDPCCGLLQNTQLEAGAMAMRSPLDFENRGNAGAHVALNWASAQPLFGNLYVQAGVRTTFTDYNGVKANGFDDEDSRTQFFWTSGLFFRANGCNEGWTGGVVFDSVSDRYYRKYDLHQLRAELSYSFAGSTDIGFRGAFALNDDWCELLQLDNKLAIEARATGTDYYTMFIRQRFEQGGEATVYGGVTEWSQGIVGVTGEAPLTDSWAIKAMANYVFPTDRGLTHREEETWNMSMGIVWYLGGNARNSFDSKRPLFDVADNGSIIQNFLR
ncbi:MAG: hypothetical protein Q4G03_03085 [Planctomycetia bacterium]|nr:hypothetical protein [Planctomycetia bacterium]